MFLPSFFFPEQMRTIATQARVDDSTTSRPTTRALLRCALRYTYYIHIHQNERIYRESIIIGICSSYIFRTHDKFQYNAPSFAGFAVRPLLRRARPYPFPYFSVLIFSSVAVRGRTGTHLFSCAVFFRCRVFICINIYASSSLYIYIYVPFFPCIFVCLEIR